MTTKIFTFFIILSYTSLVSQTLEISYDYKLTDDIFDDFKKTTNDYFVNLLIQSQKDIKKYPMEFLISDSGYSIDFSQSLQVDPEFQKVQVPKSLALSHLGLPIRLFNINGTTFTTNDDKIVISYDLKELGFWKITKEEKTILGYKCYKAYFDSNVSEIKNTNMSNPIYAWFTTDLSIKGGPTIFGNLPGLILELETKAAYFKATSIEKSKKEIKKINLKNKKLLTFRESQKYFDMGLD